jgi:hypothetical protein
VDLLSSGPDRPPEGDRTRRRWWERLWRQRWLRAVAAVLAAVAALALFRSTVDTQPVRPPPAALSPTVVSVPMPTPPYDTRPGRTPIPAPTPSGEELAGTLPAAGAPDRAAARTATALVLGRFCLDPSRYAYTLAPDGSGRSQDWRHVNVLVFDLERSYAGAALRLLLDWTGRAYRWSGPASLLRGC